MENEERLKYKIVLDAEDVPAYLESLKQQINTVLDGIGGGFSGKAGLPFGSLPSDAAFATPNVQFPEVALPAMGPSTTPTMIPMPAMDGTAWQSPVSYVSQEASQPTGAAVLGWFKGTSVILQQGYYKARDAWSSIRSTAGLAKYKFTNYFNPEEHPTEERSPLQLIGNIFEFGYDPFQSTQSSGEFSRESKQRLKDNSTIGMMDFSFGQMVGAGAGAGATIGSVIPGVGTLWGAGIGAAAGSVTWLADQVAKPFYADAIFERNITRGLRFYSPQTIAGVMSYDDIKKIAEVLSNRDADSDLRGMSIGRDDIEGMFTQLTQTEFFQRSINADNMISKIKTFTRDFTQVMHIYKAAKEDVGKIVDAMDQAGVIDYMGGNIGASARFIEGIGKAGRMDAAQATQLFQTGSEMLRGTGITMGAGGELLTSIISDIRNMLRSEEMNSQTSKQLGGDIQAALTLSKRTYDMANSPGGLMMGVAQSHELLSTTATGADNYLAGLGQITSYSDFLSETRDVMENYGKPGRMEEVAFSIYASKIKQRDKFGFYGVDPNAKAALIAIDLARTENISVPEATAIVNNLLVAPETRLQKLDDYNKSTMLRAVDEKPGWIARATSDMNNFFKSIWRGLQADASNENVQVEMASLTDLVPFYSTKTSDRILDLAIKNTPIEGPSMEKVPESITTKTEIGSLLTSEKVYSDATKGAFDLSETDARPTAGSLLPTDVTSFFEQIGLNFAALHSKDTLEFDKNKKLWRPETVKKTETKLTERVKKETFFSEGEEAWGNIYSKAKGLFKDEKDWKKGFNDKGKGFNVKEADVEDIMDSLGFSGDENTENALTKAIQAYFDERTDRTGMGKLDFKDYIQTVIKSMQRTGDLEKDIIEYGEEYGLDKEAMTDLRLDLERIKDKGANYIPALFEEDKRINTLWGGSTDPKIIERQDKLNQIRMTQAVSGLSENGGTFNVQEYNAGKKRIEELVGKFTKKLYTPEATILGAELGSWAYSKEARENTTYIASSIIKGLSGDSDETESTDLMMLAAMTPKELELAASKSTMLGGDELSGDAKKKVAESLKARQKELHQDNVWGELNSYEMSKISTGSREKTAAIIKKMVELSGDTKIKGLTDEETTIEEAIGDVDPSTTKDANRLRLLATKNADILNKVWKDATIALGIKQSDAGATAIIFGTEQERQTAQVGQLMGLSPEDRSYAYKQLESISRLNTQGSELRTSLGINGEVIQIRNTDALIEATSKASEKIYEEAQKHTSSLNQIAALMAKSADISAEQWGTTGMTPEDIFRA